MYIIFRWSSKYDEKYYYDPKISNPVNVLTVDGIRINEIDKETLRTQFETSYLI